MLIGYARVSTVQQETALQWEALKRAGVRRVFEEKRSGAGVSRPVLEEALSRLKAGDTLVVYKIDRLARSIRDLLGILDRVAAAGASFKSLTEPIDTCTPLGRMTLHLLGAIAQFEREVIRERCEAGRRAARDRGVRFGRPPLLREEEVRALVGRGLYLREAARQAGVSKNAMRRACVKYGLRFEVDGRRAWRHA